MYFTYYSRCLCGWRRLLRAASCARAPQAGAGRASSAAVASSKREGVVVIRVGTLRGKRGVKSALGAPLRSEMDGGSTCIPTPTRRGGVDTREIGIAYVNASTCKPYTPNNEMMCHSKYSTVRCANPNPRPRRHTTRGRRRAARSAAAPTAQPALPTPPPSAAPPPPLFSSRPAARGGGPPRAARAGARVRGRARCSSWWGRTRSAVAQFAKGCPWQLYRDCLRACGYLKTNGPGRRASRGTCASRCASFRAHAGETDEDVILQRKQDGVRALTNLLMFEAKRMGSVDKALGGDGTGTKLPGGGDGNS